MKRIHFIYFLVLLSSCKKADLALTKITAKNITIDSAMVSSVAIDSIISPYKVKLINEMQEVLSYTPKTLVKDDGIMQSSLGNLMADLCYEMSNPIFKKKTEETIDFTMLNNGGIRASILKGNVTKEHTFQLMPFDNELVVVEITGDKMLELITYFIKNKTAHPLSKNIELLIDKEDYTLKIKGKPFDKTKSYKVLTSDYLQRGGDKMNFFKNPKKLIAVNYKVRDAIIDYFKKTDTLKIAIDNRVIIKE